MNKLILKGNTAPNVKTIYYPDGQRSVQIDLDHFDVKTPIHIICRIKDFGEFEILLCILAALKKNDRHVAKISFKYLFGLRSDRAFNPGEPNYFRDIIKPILTHIFEEYCIFDISIFFPHGTLATRWLGSNGSIGHILEIPFIDQEDPIIIFGDKSAAINFHEYAECDFEDAIYFDKTRMHNGANVRLAIEMDKPNFVELQRLCAMFPNKEILIFDDMCDGGATFLAEAEWLKKFFPNKKRNLFVAHGIFSKGLTHLFEVFDKVITTNSYQDFPQNPTDPLYIPKDKLEVIEVI